jgi:hypothetical protein
MPAFVAAGLLLANGRSSARVPSVERRRRSLPHLQNAGESTMKSLERRREDKKKPAMTMKEKKAAKNAKKAAKNSLTVV